MLVSRLGGARNLRATLLSAAVLYAYIITYVSVILFVVSFETR